MKCPQCGHGEDRVIDSRPAREGSAIRRRRECTECQTRFTTYEYIEGTQVTVVKSDGGREVYSRAKLSDGLKRALIKRKHSDAAVLELIERIERRMQAAAVNSGEVRSRELGQLVLNELRAFDEVAYIRFASVYRQFQTLEEFLKELKAFD